MGWSDDDGVGHAVARLFRLGLFGRRWLVPGILVAVVSETLRDTVFVTSVPLGAAGAVCGLGLVDDGLGFTLEGDGCLVPLGGVGFSLVLSSSRLVAAFGSGVLLLDFVAVLVASLVGALVAVGLVVRVSVRRLVPGGLLLTPSIGRSDANQGGNEVEDVPH